MCSFQINEATVALGSMLRKYDILVTESDQCVTSSKNLVCDAIPAFLAE